MIRVTILSPSVQGYLFETTNTTYPGTAKTVQQAKRYAESVYPTYKGSTKLCHNALKVNGTVVFCVEITKDLPNGVYIVVRNFEPVTIEEE